MTIFTTTTTNKNTVMKKQSKKMGEFIAFTKYIETVSPELYNKLKFSDAVSLNLQIFELVKKYERKVDNY